MEIFKLVILFAFNSGVQASGEGPFQNWFQSIPEKVAVPLPVSSDLIVHQDQNPNATRSATFKPFQAAWAELGPDSVLRDSEWTWRVNASQFYAPYNGSDIAAPSDRQAFVSQTYDFSWSTEGNLSEALDGATGPLCVTQLSAYVDLPVNVTNAFNDSTSCVPALGRLCVEAILKRTPAPTLENGCKWGDDSYKMFNELLACTGSFGRDPTQSFGQSSSGFLLNDTATQINSGDTFWVNMSGPVLGKETWLYEKTANQIQMLLFSVSLPTNTTPVLGKELLCLRTNTTTLPDVDLNKDGVAVVGEVVLLKSGTARTAGVESLMYLGLVALIVGVILG
ncbi:hypothetical protein F5Y08DRAFT_311795 [Xylaria arbuscula]|nr:hypothetical protein F5Y08DRAFT_311795 [Xylaria arbuscula]